MRKVWIKITGMVMAAMLLAFAADMEPIQMQVYAGEDASDSDKESAYSELATYTNNLIVINKTDGHVTSELKDMLSNAKHHIYSKFSGSTSELSSYVSRVESQMDAVIAAIPASTSEFLAIIDTYQTPTVKHGETLFLILPLVNYSEVALSDVIVRPEISNLVAEWPFEPNTSGATKTILSFPPYDNEKNVQDVRQDIGFTFVVREDVKSGYYPIKFNITYSRGGKVEETTLTTYVKTIGTSDSGSLDEGDDESQISKPRIIVTGFETIPENVYAGDTFLLKINVKNTSKTASVTNVLFDMQAMEEGSDKDNTFAAFLPTSGASSIYVDSIAPGASQVLEIEMSAKSDLAQKPYVLEVNMKYDTKKAVDLSDKASVSIPILQEQRCETGDAEIIPGDIMVGEQANIMFDIFNTGKTTLYNVWVKFKADSISGGDTFIGTLAPGATGSVDAMLTAVAATMDDGKIIAEISYENESGVITTKEKELTLFVNEEFMDGAAGEADGMDMMDGAEYMDPEMEGNGSGIVKVIVPIIVVLLAGVVVFIIIRRNKKKKAAEVLDELDEIEE